MKNILFYCQHLLGVGHLTRSLNICQELVKQNRVTFIQGGSDIGRSLEHPNFTPVYLSPLAMREDTSELYSPDGSSITDVWESRRQALSSLVDQPWDALIVELYPFGRKKFKEEIHLFIDQLRQTHPHIKVICSLRDILVEKNNWEQRQEKIIQVVLDKFDHVFVHSDPQFVPLEKTFAKADQIASKLNYTGFISEPRVSAPSQRQPRVIVSTGGGVVGDNLVTATLEVAKQMNQLDFIFIKSPNMSSSLLLSLEGPMASNVKVIGFSDDYQGLLSSSQLSISLAGYNTCMNLLRTKTYGLVFPYQDSSEQILRASIFQDAGVMQVLEPADLEVARLKSIIEKSLERSDWSHVDVNLEGAVQSANWFSDTLSE